MLRSLLLSRRLAPKFQRRIGVDSRDWITPVPYPSCGHHKWSHHFPPLDVQTSRYGGNPNLETLDSAAPDIVAIPQTLRSVATT